MSVLRAFRFSEQKYILEDIKNQYLSCRTRYNRTYYIFGIPNTMIKQFKKHIELITLKENNIKLIVTNGNKSKMFIKKDMSEKIKANFSLILFVLVLYLLVYDKYSQPLNSFIDFL